MDLMTTTQQPAALHHTAHQMAHQTGHQIAHQAMLELDLADTDTGADARPCRLYGYARVSTRQQDLRRQLMLLREAGVKDEHIRTETTSGASRRPVLEELLEELQAGDILVVDMLDRLGRPPGHSLTTLTGDLASRGIGLRLLFPAIDTTDPIAGPIIISVLAALADAERRLIVERTRSGLKAARAAGRRGGRPSVMTPEKLKVARQLVAEGSTIAAAARTIGVSRPVLSRAL